MEIPDSYTDWGTAGITNAAGNSPFGKHVTVFKDTDGRYTVRNEKKDGVKNVDGYESWAEAAAAAKRQQADNRKPKPTTYQTSHGHWTVAG